MMIFATLLALSVMIASASAQNGSFKVFHSIAGGPAVDVCVGTTPLLTNLAYLAESYYLSVAPNTYSVTVHATNANPCTGAVVIAATNVVIGAGNYYTVVAHGDGSTYPYALLALQDTNTIPATGNFAVRFVHASAGNPNVDILVTPSGGSQTTLFPNVAYGTEQTAASVPAGTYTVEAVVTGDGTVVAGPVDITFSGQTVYTIFASGTTTPPLSATLAIDATALVANVKVIHAVAELNAPAVDVFINGVKAITNFKYKTAVGYVQIPVLQTTIEIYLTGTTTSVLTPVTITPAADAYYSIVAHGAALPISLLLLADNNTRPGTSDVNIRFVHASAGSPAVDIKANGAVLFSDVTYGNTGTPVYATAPAQQYVIEAVLAGTDTVVVGPYQLNTKGREVISIYALGIAGNTDNTKLDALPLEDAPLSITLQFSASPLTAPSAMMLITLVGLVSALLF